MIIAFTEAQAAKFNSLDLAIAYRNRLAENGRGMIPIILGDDEKFWVADCNRIAYKLIRAGYESHNEF